MLRIPGSINSKNGATVTILKRIKSQPANINLLVGSFCGNLASEQIKEEATKLRQANYHKVSVTNNGNDISR
jgi:hypothetical protein